MSESEDDAPAPQPVAKPAAASTGSLPFQGRDSTKQRNARTRQKRKVKAAERALQEASGSVRPESLIPTQPAVEAATSRPAAGLGEAGALTMLSLSNKNRNKRRGFKQGLEDAASMQPRKIVFADEPALAVVDEVAPVKAPVKAARRVSAAPLVPPSARTSIPAGLIITSVDVEADDFEPGEPQPNFRPPRGVQHPVELAEAAPAVDWAAWPTEAAIKARWASLPSIANLAEVAHGDRVAVRVLELNDAGSPELVTVAGVAVCDAPTDEPMLRLQTAFSPLPRDFHFAQLAGAVRLP